MDPDSFDEYMRLYRANHRLEGSGLGTVIIVPCPFCAAPDWQEWRVFSIVEDSTRDTLCAECGRSARVVSDDGPDTISAEIVQTGGPDPPAWFEPPPRRIDERTRD